MLVALAESLRQSISGAVLLPNDAGWTDATCGFNLAVTQRPDLVVAATSADDVVESVRFAVDNGMPVAVQATGHGAAVPTDGGLLVNTSAMRSVRIDPGEDTAAVAAGARWQQVIDAAGPHGLAPLNGSSTTVGVVGYTLGGGIGPMARTFGFAADRVRRVQLVTADGVLRDVTAESDADLFWALRGGKCQLGIVTELEFGLLPVAHYYGGGLFFDGDHAPDVLHAWREWVVQLPEQANSSVALLRLPDLPAVPEPLRGRLTVHLRYLYVGEAGPGERALAPLRAAAPALMDTIGVTPYAEVGSVHADPTDPLPLWDTSCLLPELPGAAVDTLLAVAGPGREVPLIVVELRHLGGALQRAPLVHNAVGGREGGFNVYAVGPLPPPLADVTPAVGRGLVEALQPWSTGRSLINFHGSASPDAAGAWDADTRARLDELHLRYDPYGTFRFAHPGARPR